VRNIAANGYDFNIKKFGNSYYGEYMKRVPGWNAFKGLRNLGNR